MSGRDESGPSHVPGGTALPWRTAMMAKVQFNPAPTNSAPSRVRFGVGGVPPPPVADGAGTGDPVPTRGPPGEILGGATTSGAVPPPMSAEIACMISCSGF